MESVEFFLQMENPNIIYIQLIRISEFHNNSINGLKFNLEIYYESFKNY